MTTPAVLAAPSTFGRLVDLVVAVPLTVDLDVWEAAHGTLGGATDGAPDMVFDAVRETFADGTDGVTMLHQYDEPHGRYGDRLPRGDADDQGGILADLRLTPEAAQELAEALDFALVCLRGADDMVQVRVTATGAPDARRVQVARSVRDLPADHVCPQPPMCSVDAVDARAFGETA